MPGTPTGTAMSSATASMRTLSPCSTGTVVKLFATPLCNVSGTGWVENSSLVATTSDVIEAVSVSVTETMPSAVRVLSVTSASVDPVMTFAPVPIRTMLALIPVSVPSTPDALRRRVLRWLAGGADDVRGVLGSHVHAVRSTADPGGQARRTHQHDSRRQHDHLPRNLLVLPAGGDRVDAAGAMGGHAGKRDHSRRGLPIHAAGRRTGPGAVA